MMTTQLKAAIIVVVCSLLLADASINKLKEKRPPLRHMTGATRLPICRDLIKNRTGLACEEYAVTTSDQFELNLVHLLPKAAGAKVVYLQHGLLGSASCWFDQNRTASLGYILHDLGYDVWAGNSRGNWYSIQNNQWPPTSDQLWDNVDFDLMGKIDLPAFLSFITRTTGAEKVAYVGHSQGTTQMFAALAKNYPGVADKITVFIAMAPVTRCMGITNPAMREMATDTWDLLLQLFGGGSFPPLNMSAAEVLERLNVKCDDPGDSLCENVIYDFSGASTNLVNNTELEEDLGFDPAGTSMRNMHHWLQDMKYDGFRMYDFGFLGNLQHYGTTSPPIYDLTSINNVKIALYSGTVDELATPEDVAWALTQLPASTIIAKKVLDYAHNDFIWATNAFQILYPEVVQLIEANSGDEARCKRVSGKRGQ